MDIPEIRDEQYMIPTYKCILLGGHCSGKTSYVKQLNHAYTNVLPGKYHKYISTKFTHVHRIIINTTVCDIQFELYDTPPNSTHYSLYDEVDCCIIIFDYMRNSTFQSVTQLVNNFKNRNPLKPLVICGNKIYDDMKSININNLMKHLGNHKNIYYCEICIQDNFNLMSPFQIFLEKLTIIPRIVM